MVTHRALDDWPLGTLRMTRFSKLQGLVPTIQRIRAFLQHPQFLPPLCFRSGCHSTPYDGPMLCSAESTQGHALSADCVPPAGESTQLQANPMSGFVHNTMNVGCFCFSIDSFLPFFDVTGSELRTSRVLGAALLLRVKKRCHSSSTVTNHVWKALVRNLMWQSG